MKIHYAPELELGAGILSHMVGEAACGAGKGRSHYGLNATNRTSDVTCARCLKTIAANRTTAGEL